MHYYTSDGHLIAFVDGAYVSLDEQTLREERTGWKALDALDALYHPQWVALTRKIEHRITGKEPAPEPAAVLRGGLGAQAALSLLRSSPSLISRAVGRKVRRGVERVTTLLLSGRARG